MAGKLHLPLILT
jgi:hypothetical protein